MSDLPPGWVRAKVGEVAESVQSGFASGQHNRDGVGVPHLRPMNVSRDGRLALDDMRFVQDSDGHRLRRGDVLFNNTNSAELVGKTTWIATDDELAYSNHMTRVRLPPGLSPEFVARQLHHLWSRGVFELLCNNHVSQASVSARTLSDAVEIAVPPAAEQRRIVTRIEELTVRSRRAREALDAVPALLDKLRQSILAAAFRGDLTADWRASHSGVEPAEELLERLRADRRLRWEATIRAKGQDPAHKTYRVPPRRERNEDLPDSWAVASWDELSDWVTYGFTRPMPHVDEGVPIVTAKSVSGGRIDFESAELTTHDAFAALSEKDRPRPGDILVTKDGSIGRAAIVNSERPFCINQSVAVVWLRDCPCDREYLLRAIEAPFTQGPIREGAGPDLARRSARGREQFRSLA